MDDRRKELIQTLRAEGQSLFQANQAGRLAAERITALIFGISGVTVVAGINSKTDDVAIALPPVVLLLVSYALQQYVDVSVLGAARRHVETRLRDELGDYGMFYETVVAPVRKQGTLTPSFRLLQGLTAAAVVAVVIVGTVVAFDGQPTYIEIGYTTAIALAGLSVGWSFHAMLRSFRFASKQIAGSLAESAQADELRTRDPMARDLSG